MKKILILIFLLNSLIGIAQFYPGGEPTYIKWKQINTDTVRVIFPEGLDSNAARVASLVHHMYSNNTESIGKKKWKINILLHNQTQVSNGFVASSRFRSEFFASAPFQSHRYVGSGDWMDLLTIHEYRHVLQYMNTRQGISKIIQWLYGDFGIGFSTIAFAPNWFSEGDAIIQETALSNSGRGRAPAFTAQQRAILSNDIMYSYGKWKNRSYKDLVPDHYKLGYQMCNYTRNKYGNNFWAKPYSEAVRFSGIPYPMSTNLKRNGAKRTNKICKEALVDLRLRYLNHIEKNGSIPTNEVKTLKSTKRVETYKIPRLYSDSSILCIKSTFKEIPAIYEIDHEGNEYKITTLGNAQIGSYFSYRNHKLTWAEFVPDPRWQQRSYNNIVVFDINTGEKKFITSKTKYQSPAFSPDASKIVVVEVTPNLKYNLVIIDANNGNVLEIINCPHYPTFPQWENENEIVFTARNNNMSFLCKLSLPDKSYTNLTPPSYNSIGIPSVTEEEIVFSASFNGIDNIYSYSESTKKVKQLSAVKIGAYEPVYDSKNEKLIFTEYIDELGTRLSYLDKSKWKNELYPIQKERDSILDKELFAIDAMNSEGGSILEDFQTNEFEIKDYKKLPHSIGIHGWGLSATQNEALINLSSNDILGTLSANAIYHYDINTSENYFTGEIVYTNYYPIFKSSITQALNRNYYHKKGGNIRIDTHVWNEKSYNIGIAIPLDFSKHNFSRNIHLETNYSFTEANFIKNPDFVQNLNINAINLSGSFVNHKFKAYQQIYTPFGQELTLQFQKALNNEATQLNINSKIYLPGLAKTHSLFLDINYQKRIVGDDIYMFANQFDFARGYSNAPNDYILKLGTNYSLPILYPDFGINGIFFLKRIRTNLFYDFSVANFNFPSVNSEFRSIGIEFNFDINVYDLLPISIGFGYAYLLDQDYNNPNRTGFFFPLVNNIP